MKILVTGGAGFIGSHIVENYLQQGHQVIVLDDLSSGNPDNLPKKVPLVEMNIANPEIKKIFEKEKPEIVNHHAAQIDVRKSVADPQEDAKTNILGTLNLLELCRRHDVKKFIFASTGGALYGEQNTFPAAESHKTDPASPYGIAKLAIEKYLQFYFWTYKLPFAILRYANVYGPRQNGKGEAGVVAIFIEKLLKKESPVIYGDGNQTRDYVFVGDVVSCNNVALGSHVRGIYNVGTGIETDVNTIAHQLSQIMGKKNILPRYAPARKGEQKRSCIKPGSLQPRPPTSLAEGLQKTVAWFQNR